MVTLFVSRTPQLTFYETLEVDGPQEEDRLVKLIRIRFQIQGFFLFPSMISTIEIKRWRRVCSPSSIGSTVDCDWGERPARFLSAMNP